MKKTIKHLLYYVVLLLNFPISSCTKEIVIDVPKPEEKMVVYATITPFLPPKPKELKISLKNSAYIFDTVFYDIKDANLLFYENNKLIDTLYYNEDKKGYLITKDISDYPKVGSNYSIQIEKDGYQTITANTYIPAIVQPDSIVINPIAYINEDGGVFSEISITFTDPLQDTNYYEIIVSDPSYDYYTPKMLYELSSTDNLITSEAYYPSLLNPDIKYPQYILFSDNTIAGATSTIHLYYFPPQDMSNIRYISDHYIDIHFRNVTKEYYLFKTTLLRNRVNQIEDILNGMAEPLNVFSNIENGYGLFSGYNEYLTSLHIDSTKVY